MLALVFGAGAAAAGGGNHQSFTPGASGAGDSYFPLDGNGGYDVQHYLLDLRYNPSTDVLRGVATIRARATQNLSRFDLDFQGLTISSLQVNGQEARWRRDGQELVVTPDHGIPDGATFRVRVAYRGIPQGVEGAGFIHTDDGAVIIGEPHVAATWFPANDHPSDKASYTIHMAVPAGLEAVANGVLVSHVTTNGWTTWVWDAKEPLASYLATATVGQFKLHAHRHNGIRIWDAFDPDLYDTTGVPRTGRQFAVSQKANSSYKRLARTISVPAAGAKLSFWIKRDTEQDWDFVFVEARTVGKNDWTTLRDLNGHTSEDTGFSCPGWHDLHPFLTHYQSDTCAPRGTTGHWWAATGESGGYEHWRVGLSRYAGEDVRVSISYASDESFQFSGAFVDDIVVSSGAGTTSFEADGNVMDGWTVPGAPAGSPGNTNDWIVGTKAVAPPPIGAAIDASFAREDEILDFESSTFGRYPFAASGGLVDDVSGLGFALENQTRPIYDKGFFAEPESGDSVLVHELAHQWYGDSLSVKKWRHIWLNEGFATYAEWLWSEREGLGTVQEIFDSVYDGIPPDDPFWSVIVGNPGPDLLFDSAIYDRGAMTLQQLRLAVGDEDFFKILRRWASSHAYGNVTTSQFIQLAEQISGQNLDDLFQTWLFTPGRPQLSATSTARLAPPALAANTKTLWLRSEAKR
ncbi:MAG TPA: M1 family aminopeptidase [Gaiellaceae bacterium]